jgi:hypothetical protein
LALVKSFAQGQEATEAVLQRVHDISTNDAANLCYHRQFE